jgi:hypothetical protein
MVNVDSPKNLTTHGGPHFVVLDGREQRIAFSNYFVDLTAFGLPGTGSGGDDKICIARILSNGQLIFDAKFRDELTGAVYVDFDRPTSYNWPNRGPTGNAKPHAMSLSAWTQAIDREAQQGDTYKILNPLLLLHQAHCVSHIAQDLVRRETAQAALPLLALDRVLRTP